MDVIAVFAQNVKMYRHRLGVSQEEFAERAKLHRTYISAIECGKRSIALENIQKIADALEIETYLLFIDTKNPHISINTDNDSQMLPQKNMESGLGVHRK